MKLSLILPCFNEEENIEATVRSCVTWLRDADLQGEIIVVNDGSRDSSALLLGRLQKEIPHLRVVTHERNLGYGAALSSGCDAASCEFIAFMDSDGQFHPTDFTLLIPHLQQFAFVAGWRRKRADTFLRCLSAALFNCAVRIVLSVHVRDPNCAMKIFHASLWPLIRPRHSSGAMFNVEVFYALKRQGIAWKQIPVPHYQRLKGKSTGGNPLVILRALRDLWRMRRNEMEK